MPRLNIRIDNYGQPVTVSQMRRQLAQVISKMPGDQEVKFTFVAVLEEYQPAPTVHQIEAEENAEPTIVFGELARPENN